MDPTGLGGVSRKGSGHQAGNGQIPNKTADGCRVFREFPAKLTILLSLTGFAGFHRIGSKQLNRRNAEFQTTRTKVLMRQRGLQQGDGIRRHAFGVRRSFSFGVGDWLRPIVAICYPYSEVRGCSGVFVRLGFVKKSTPVPLVH